MTVAQTVLDVTAAPRDGIAAAIVVVDVTEKLRRGAMRVATRVGAEAGAVMMIADTHAVTEEVMGTTTAAVAVLAENARALARLAGTTVRGMTTATAMSAANTETETKTGPATGVHPRAMPHLC